MATRSIRKTIVADEHDAWMVELQRVPGSSENWILQAKHHEQGSAENFERVVGGPYHFYKHDDAKRSMSDLAALIDAAVKEKFGRIAIENAIANFIRHNNGYHLGRSAGEGIVAGLREKPPFPGPSEPLSMLIGDNRWHVRAREITHAESLKDGEGFYVFVTVEPVPPEGSRSPRDFDETTLTRRICNSVRHMDTVVAATCAVVRLIATLHEGEPWKPLRFSLLEMIP